MKMIKETNKAIVYETMSTDNVDILFKQMENDWPEMMAEFKRLQSDEYVLFCKKQADYGPSNITMGGNIQKDDDNRMAIIGLVIRLNDKMQRLLNLVVKQNMHKGFNESIEDTFMDISNYANIALIVKNKKWGK